MRVQEEQFISLLDVLEDDNKAAPKLEELKPSEPESRSNPAQANVDVGSFDKMELPWVRASRDITSPTLRLHNGTSLSLTLKSGNMPSLGLSGTTWHRSGPSR